MANDMRKKFELDPVPVASEVKKYASGSVRAVGKEKMEELRKYFGGGADLALQGTPENPDYEISHGDYISDAQGIIEEEEIVTNTPDISYSQADSMAVSSYGVVSDKGKTNLVESDVTHSINTTDSNNIDKDTRNNIIDSQSSSTSHIKVKEENLSSEIVDTAESDLHNIDKVEKNDINTSNYHDDVPDTSNYHDDVPDTSFNDNNQIYSNVIQSEPKNERPSTSQSSIYSNLPPDFSKMRINPSPVTTNSIYNSDGSSLHQRQTTNDQNKSSSDLQGITINPSENEKNPLLLGSPASDSIDHSTLYSRSNRDNNLDDNDEDSLDGKPMSYFLDLLKDCCLRCLQPLS